MGDDKPGDLHSCGGGSTTSCTPACALGPQEPDAYVACVRRRFILPWVLGIGLLISACAGNASADGVTVTAKEMHFTPSTLHVRAGEQTISVHNAGKLTHTFSLNALGREVTVHPGQTRTLTLDLKPGTYRYVCRILDHEGLGMHGVLRVSAK